MVSLLFVFALRRLIRRVAVIHGAECLIVHEFGDGRVVAAYRAIFVAANFECVEVHLQGVVHQQATDEWIPLSEYEFDNFCGLHEANCAGQYAQHACFVSRWCQVCRGGRGIEAAVARPFSVARVHRDLTFKAEDAAIHDGFFEEDTRVVDEVARWEIVASVDDDIVFGEDVHDVVGCEIVGVWHHITAGVDFFEGFVSRDGFETPQVRCAVQYLALQVGDIDNVGIDNSECPNASRGEIESGWAAQSARANEEHFGVEEFALSAFSHFGDEEVTGVALYFGFVERAVLVDVETGVFP